MIAIIDYGMGNLRSVQKAMERVGADAKIASNASDLKEADKLVLPGVGAIAPAMDKLQELGLVDAIKEEVANGKPLLGICVGYQLLFDSSDEGGDVQALGIIPGKVTRFTEGKIPQMGWNQVAIQSAGEQLFDGVEDESNFYFCHSYYCAPTSDDVVATKTEYGVSYASSIVKDNVYGVQFHPEKSQKNGLKVLENFFKC